MGRRRPVITAAIIAACIALWLFRPTSEPSAEPVLSQPRSGIPPEVPPALREPDPSPPKALPEPEKEVEAEPPTNPGTTVLVRDLANGAVVEDETARKLLERFESSGAEDDAGASPPPPAGGESSRSDAGGHPDGRTSDEWVAASQSRDEVAESKVFWVYRRIHVTGSVKLENAPPDGQYPVALRLFATREDGTLEGSPSTEVWLQGHGFRKWPIDVLRTGPSGSFEAWIPRIAGLYLSADIGGWLPCTLAVPTSVESWSPEIFLRASPVVSGVLRGPDGKPLHGQLVVAYVVNHGRHDDWGPNLFLKQPGGGISGSKHRELDVSRSSMKARTRTEKDGTFSIPLRGSGEVHLYAYPEEFSLCEAKLGTVTADHKDIVMEAPAQAGPSSVVLRFNGKLAVGKEATLIDLSGYPQPTMKLHTDDKGRIPANWLVSGRLYGFHIYGLEALGGKGAEARWGVWSGENEIDLATLSSKPPDIGVGFK